jgi:hypothetical protein
MKVLFAVLLAVSAAFAGNVEITSAGQVGTAPDTPLEAIGDYYYGTLSSSQGGGIDGFGLWANGAFSLSYKATWYSATQYLYEYTFTITQKDMSHWILGLSDNCTAACIVGLTVSGTSAKQAEVKTYTPQDGNSNPGMPGNLYGVKWDISGDGTGTFTFSFFSDRVPVFQNFYAKDGRGGGDWTYAYNTGFANGMSMLLAPDTKVLSVVPEPHVYVGLAPALLALAYVARKRKLNQQAQE